MKHFYLFATIIGAVIPYIFFIDFFISEGTYLQAFVAGVVANSAASGFTADLLVSSFVFWAYLGTNKVRRIWVYILLNLTIGLSCALPYYLYVQARDAEQQLEG